MLRNRFFESGMKILDSYVQPNERIAMFKSIRKGGRIAAVTIGIVAALTPLATPPRGIS